MPEPRHGFVRRQGPHLGFVEEEDPGQVVGLVGDDACRPAGDLLGDEAALQVDARQSDVAGASDDGLVAGDRQASLIEGDVLTTGAFVARVEDHPQRHRLPLPDLRDLGIAGAGIFGDEHRQTDAHLRGREADSRSGEHGRSHHLGELIEFGIIDLPVEGSGVGAQDRVPGLNDGRGPIPRLGGGEDGPDLVGDQRIGGVHGTVPSARAGDDEFGVLEQRGVDHLALEGECTLLRLRQVEH